MLIDNHIALKHGHDTLYISSGTINTSYVYHMIMNNTCLQFYEFNVYNGSVNYSNNKFPVLDRICLYKNMTLSLPLTLTYAMYWDTVMLESEHLIYTVV